MPPPPIAQRYDPLIFRGARGCIEHVSELLLWLLVNCKRESAVRTYVYTPHDGKVTVRFVEFCTLS